jgi:hypothetical protein
VLCSQQSLKLLEIEPELLHNNPSNLVAETLRGNDCNLIADSLVGLEIEGQLGVVSLNDDLGGLLDGLGTNAAHNCGCEGLSKLKLSMSSGISESLVVVWENSLRFCSAFASAKVSKSRDLYQLQIDPKILLTHLWYFQPHSRELALDNEYSRFGGCGLF